ncbi:hypothetical protein AAW14_29600 [Streptomyces hygroscopicus]|nr:hypothetical protein [Streptomyces hygroscopicus]
MTARTTQGPGEALRADGQPDVSWDQTWVQFGHCRWTTCATLPSRYRQWWRQVRPERQISQSS